LFIFTSPLSVARLVTVGDLLLGCLVASIALSISVTLTIGGVNNILDLGLGRVSLLIITTEFNGFLVLELELALDLVAVLDLATDFSLELVLVVTVALELLAEFDLGTLLEFEVVLLLEFLFLLAASLDIGLNLEFTSAETLVDGGVSMAVGVTRAISAVRIVRLLRFSV